MKRAAFIILLTIVFGRLYPQCTSGNCATGSGTFNFGWCIYTGEFKDGKPEGKGSMKYDDYTYTGHFSNGLEDGEGIITNKNGSSEKVTYKAGKKIVPVLVRVPENEYKSLVIQDVNCLTGDCITGYGTYRFPSGNKYTGNFKQYKREGQGTFYFADGDKYEGLFHNNEKASGTYYFNTGAKYSGNYDSNGMEYNGTITSVTGMTIPYVNGKPIIPVAPKVPVGVDQRGSNGQQKAAAGRIRMPCSVCFGTGKTSRTEDWSNYGAGQGGGREHYQLERVYSNCYKCHGSGVE